MTTTHKYRFLCQVLRIITCLLLVFLVIGFAYGVYWAFFVLENTPVDSRLPQNLQERLAGSAIIFRVRVFEVLGFIWALWAVQRAFGDLAAGRLFNPTLAKAMRQAGAGFLIPMILGLTVLVLLSFFIRGGINLINYFNGLNIIIAVIACLLILLARVVDQARTVKTELDEIF